MAQKYKTIMNPFTGTPQRVLKEPTFAVPEEHTHAISDITGLEEEIEQVKKPTGYFAG